MIKTTEEKMSNLRIIALGGLEEVGRNMTVFEYKDDIIIVDMGLQFPEEDMPGIDYIIPNTAYLKDKKDRIRGIIITHGHYDHIGAIPHSMGRLGNPPIYATPLTAGIIKKRQEDFPQAPRLNIHEIKETDKIDLGCFKIEFFHVNHNIPDGVGIVIDTPVGRLVHTGDFKFDHTPVGDKPIDISRLKEISQPGVKVLMSDSTSAEKPGHSISEKEIQDNLEIIFKEAPGRIIIATFASLISRVQEVLNLAEKYDRKVAIDGYSMKTNVEIAKKLGYLKSQKGTIIRVNRANDYPNKKIVILCTGAQGEDNAVLMRIVNQEHRHIKIQKGDAIIFSSSVVPGNERTVQSLKDVLWRQGGRVYHYQMMDIHAGGHGQEEDLRAMLELIKPKFFIPIHGSYYMLKLHGEIAEAVGIPSKNIIIGRNGKVILLGQKSIKISEERVPNNYVMVDGLGVGDVGQVVLRDRQTMAQDGMFVIIAVINSKTGRVYGEPDIISRGFVYLRESKDLLDQVRRKIKEIVSHTATSEHTVNWVYVKENIRDKIGQFLYTKTQRRPMVLPVIIEI
ncbi:MAG: ribonuclease J [Candidatus Portnoybacteria bacterium CG_4_9_14_3_um_filter_43_11]|uniref:Ribonuclease J n=1 Tax=Candidatus Portnoybacteria bacterium CG_4_9_14_3_um_filter_43_11 TaxID=1974805 RepID=A0A2M7YM46_9BACT|nr:MAG: ribonuclease J [Candidatus Portnoybacteria bacterium CG_4_9_14_3_um_filter_43_11]